MSGRPGSATSGRHGTPAMYRGPHDTATHDHAHHTATHDHAHRTATHDRPGKEGVRP